MGTHCVHPIATELSPLRRDGLVIPPREVEWPQDNAPRETTRSNNNKWGGVALSASDAIWGPKAVERDLVSALPER